MKKQLALMLALRTALCRYSPPAARTQAADPGFDNVVSAIEGAVPTDGMAQMDSGYIENMFKLTAGDYEQCLVMSTNVGTTIDEFGLFKGADSAQAEALHTAVKDYLQLRLDAWMPEYLPDEFPKLQNAQVWTEPAITCSTPSSPRTPRPPPAAPSEAALRHNNNAALHLRAAALILVKLHFDVLKYARAMRGTARPPYIGR